MNERKDEIRAAMKARRKAVTQEARKAASEELSNRLFVENCELGAAISKKGPIAVYLASKEEIDLADFIAAVLSFGCAVVAPRWNGTEYELVRIDNLETLVKGPHGILQPLFGAGRKLGCAKLTLVTDHERESVVSNGQTVEVISAADWLRQREK